MIGVASIAISVAVAIISFGVLFGYKEAIRQKVFMFAPHLRITSLTVSNNYEEGPLPLHTPLWNSLSQHPEIKRHQAVAHKAGILKTDEEQKGILLKGVGPDYDWDLLKTALVEGRLIAPGKDSSYLTEIIVSRKIAGQLKVKPGDKVLLYFLQMPPRVRNVTVAGIYQTDLEEFDDHLVIGDLSMVQHLNNWGRDTVGSYEIYVRDFDRLEHTAEQIFADMQPNMFQQKVTDTFRPVFDWLAILDTNTWILLSLILFVACFNMISILLVMIMERTPLIGLLKTLGSPNTQIRAIFIRVGLHLMIRGLVIGNVTGLLLCWAQYRYRLIPLDPVNYFMDTVPISFSWPAIVLVNLATVLINWAVLLIPTILITRIQPIRALTFKK